MDKGQNDRRSGPTTRPAFAKATEVKCGILRRAKKRIHYLCGDVIEKSVLHDQHLTSLVIPNDDPPDDCSIPPLHS